MKLLLSLLFTLTALIALAQPSNDECTGAIPLNIVDYEAGTYPVNLSLSTQSTFTETAYIEPIYSYSEYDFSFTGKDVWYSFNSGNHSQLEALHDVFSACGTRLSIDYENGYSLNRNQEYLIAVREFNVVAEGDNYPFPTNGYVLMIFSNPLVNNTQEKAISINLPTVSNTIELDSTQIYPEGNYYYKATTSSNITVKTNFAIRSDDGQITNLQNNIYQLSAGHEYIFSGSADQVHYIENLITPLANNNCSSSKILNVSTTRSNSTVGNHNVLLYDDTGSGPRQGLGLPTSYYSFIAPSTGTIEIETTAETINLYSDCTGTNNQIIAGSYITNLSSGSTYYLAISSSENHDIRLIVVPPLYSNDACDNPISLPLDGTSTEIQFTNSTNTATSTISPPSANPELSDRWYEINTTADYIEICKNSFTEYQLYTLSGDCSTAEKFGTHIASSDCDILDAPPGSNFLLRVYGNSTESISITIPTAETPAINDECSGALPITANQNISLGEMLDATPSSNGSCSGDNGIRDLWYTLTPTQSRTIYLSSSSNSTTVQLYTGGCESLQLIDCNISNNKMP